MEKIESKVKELLKLLQIDAEVSVSESDESFTVSIDAKDDNALLIGKHGNTLTSLEYIIYILCNREMETPKRITVEIGGYRQEREAYLADLAQRLKEEVIASGTDKTVRGLKPWERRHIHMTLSEDTEVITESEGEDRDRVLVIKKKS